jgi:hypothetical protein
LGGWDADHVEIDFFGDPIVPAGPTKAEETKTVDEAVLPTEFYRPEHRRMIELQKSGEYGYWSRSRVDGRSYFVQTEGSPRSSTYTKPKITNPHTLALMERVKARMREANERYRRELLSRKETTASRNPH